MSPRSSKALGTIILLGAWGVLLWQVLRHFDPGSSFTGWNADVAITTLQSNDPVFDPFRLYYYGQDRIGAWPWLLAQGLRALTGMDWTPWRSFVWQATWACLACLALRGLQREAGWLLAAVFASLALLSELLQVQLFALSQPFGWQLTALFLAWWALVRLLQRLERPDTSRGAIAGWALSATLFCTLACWTSPTSGPLLGVAIGAEGTRLWLANAGAGRRRRLLAAFLPLAVGITFEAVVRGIFHRFARQHFGKVINIDKDAPAAAAQRVDQLVAGDRKQPWGKRGADVPGVPLQMDRQQNVLHDVLGLIDRLPCTRKATARRGPEHRRDGLEQAMIRRTVA